MTQHSWRRSCGVVLATLATVAAPLALVTAAPAAAQPQTLGTVAGRLAIVRAGASGAGIYTVNPDGSSVVGPVRDGGAVRTPDFSPDGSRLAFTDGNYPDRQLYTSATDGTDVQQLTDGTAGAFSSTWSPDGTEIAYITTQDDLMVVPSGGGTPRLLVDTDCLNYAAWAADGFIYYTPCERAVPNGYDLHRVAGGGGQPEVVAATPEAEMYVDVSPTGTVAVSTSPRVTSPDEPARLWLMQTDGTARRAVHTSSDVLTPSFSPDGTQLAVVTTDRPYGAPARTHIYDLPSGTLRVVPSEVEQSYNVAWQPLPAGSDPAPGAFPTDTTAPVITITAPADGARVPVGQPVTLSFACTDPAGIALCGVFNGEGAPPLASGDPLPKLPVGDYTFTVIAQDRAGTVSSRDFSYSVVESAGDVVTFVNGGETVTTGATATPDVPVVTSIQVPAAVDTSTTSRLSVDAQPAGTNPSGFALFGQQVTIEGPAATAAAPYVMTFSIDATQLNGTAPADVAVWRNGVQVAGCTDPIAAVPDPCIVSRGFAPDSSGDARVTVRTSHFSTWTLGRPTYSLTGPLSPVLAAPTVNVVKPGTTVPVRFKLGGDRGLDVLRGTPSTTVTSCGTGAQKAVATLNNVTTRLAYEPTTQSYVYLWQTSKSWKGCRNLVLSFRDGSTLRTLYNLK